MDGLTETVGIKDTDEAHEILLREYQGEDRSALTTLWVRTFQDPPELVAAFFDLLPKMGSGCIAEKNGEILGAAYILDGYRLRLPGQPNLRCGYLYAVAVDEQARGCGFGTALSQEAAKLGQARGAELICTLPAEPSLYRWYEKILGLRCSCRRKVYYTADLPKGACKIRAREYLEQRETLLQDIPHVVPELPVMEYQRLLCEAYGGGLYSAGDLLFCGYRDGESWFFPELLADGEESLKGFTAVARDYLCSDRPFPGNFLWNLTLD